MLKKYLRTRGGPPTAGNHQVQRENVQDVQEIEDNNKKEYMEEYSYVFRDAAAAGILDLSNKRYLSIIFIHHILIHIISRLDPLVEILSWACKSSYFSLEKRILQLNLSRNLLYQLPVAIGNLSFLHVSQSFQV